MSEAAEEHSSKAERLSTELNVVREQYIKLQRQVSEQFTWINMHKIFVTFNLV